MILRSPFINATSARKQAGLDVRPIEMQGETLFFAEGRQITRLELSGLAGLRLKVIEKNVREQVQIVSEAFGGAMQSQLRAVRPTRGSQPEGQRLLEEIDGLEKGTVSHLSFVFPIRRLQFGRVVADSFIKHERLLSL